MGRSRTGFRGRRNCHQHAQLPEEVAVFRGVVDTSEVREEAVLRGKLIVVLTLAASSDNESFSKMGPSTWP